MSELLILVTALALLMAGYQSLRIIVPLSGIIIGYILAYYIAQQVNDTFIVVAALTFLLGSVIASFLGTIMYALFSFWLVANTTKLLAETAYRLLVASTVIPKWAAGLLTAVLVTWLLYMFVFSNVLRHVVTFILAIAGSAVLVAIASDTAVSVGTVGIQSLRNYDPLYIVAFSLLVILGVSLQSYRFSRSGKPDDSRRLWSLEQYVLPPSTGTSYSHKR